MAEFIIIKNNYKKYNNKYIKIIKEKNFESVSNNEENKAIMHHSMIKKSNLNNKEKQLQKNSNINITK